MTFDLPLAHLVALGCTITLTVIAHQNRRSGWRRQRTNLVMDMLLKVAQMRAAERQHSITARESTPVPVGDLIAMHTALQMGAGKAPDHVPTVAASAAEEVEVTQKAQ